MESRLSVSRFRVASMQWYYALRDQYDDLSQCSVPVETGSYDVRGDYFWKSAILSYD
ncbi:MAG: hypothetical protein VB933_05765 [Pseudomonadales bacterium]